MTVEIAPTNQADILEVISSLSNDQVFTPPRVVNAVLDMLPPEVWKDPKLRWLDPGCKTGIFPREIIKRLMRGLEDSIPDEQSRLEHILRNMIFAIATAEITSLMSRRTIYCSKEAASEFSSVTMNSNAGNVWFYRTEHSYVKGRCSECGGSEAQLEQAGHDNYAYGFIHKSGFEKIKKEFPEMKFDVIIGNPPYQMDGGSGGTSASPLYNVFVEQAKALNPKFLAMILPSRWMAGGRGLDEFRSHMLQDKKIRFLYDFPNTRDVFPGVDIKGGVCYFLWDRDYLGPAKMTLIRGSDVFGPVERNLDEHDVLVRDSRAVGILKKVLDYQEPKINQFISGNTPFGLATNFRKYRIGGKPKQNEVRLYGFGGGKRFEANMLSSDVTKNRDLINVWKVLLPAAYGAGEEVPHQILGKSILAEPGSVCTQTYLTLGPFNTEKEALNAQIYLNTRFARFLVSLRKISQDAQSSTYSWVPVQNWRKPLSDEILYKKYEITEEEQAYIESMIKEMPA